MSLFLPSLLSGGVHVWAYSVFEITILILFFLFFLNHVAGQYRSSKRLGKNASITLQWVVSPLNIFFLLIISLNDSYLLYNIGLYWVFRSSLLPIDEDSFRNKTEDGQSSIISLQRTRKNGIKRFQELLKRSLKLNKTNWKKSVEGVWRYYPDEKIVMGIIPDDEDKELSLKVKEWIGRRKKI